MCVARVCPALVLMVYALCMNWLIAAQPTIPKVKTNPQITHQYIATIIITYDPSLLPLNTSLVNEAIGFVELRNRATHATGIPIVGLLYTFDAFDADQQAGRLVGSLWVGIVMEAPDAQVETPAVWEAVVEEIEDALSSTARRLEQRRLERWSLKRDLLQQKRKDIESRLEDAVAEAVGSRGAIDVGNEIQKLWSKKNEASLDLATIEARRQSVAERIEELKNTGTTAELDREIIEQLEQIVEFQEKNIQMLKRAFATRAVTEHSIAEGEAELAKARIDLLRAKKEAAAKSSPELDALSAELSQTTIAAAEQRAVLQEIESRIEELKQAIDEQAQRKRAAQEAEHRAALLREQLATIERRLSAMELEWLEREASRGGMVTIVPWTAAPDNG